MLGFSSRIKKWNRAEFVEECLWTIHIAKQYKSTVFVHICLGVISIVMSLVSFVASKTLIDAVIAADSGVIGLAAGLFVGMRVLSLVFKSCAQRIGAVVDVRVHNEIQSKVYHSILNSDWIALNQIQSGDLLERIGRDAGILSSGVTHFVPSLISSLVQLIGGFVLIYACDSTMAWIVLAGVPVSVLASGFLMKRMRFYNEEMKESLSELMSFQQDSFQNLTMIKAFGLNDWFNQKLTGLHQQYQKKFLSYNLFSVMTSFLVGCLSLGASVCCFGWAIYRLFQKQMTYGEMTMILQLTAMLASSFSSLTSLVPSLISIATSARRLMDVATLKEETAKASEKLMSEAGFDVVLEHVSFGYDDQHVVLDDCSLQLKDGEMVVLSGASGCGKTTLFRLLLGLVKANEGSAVLIGKSGMRYEVSSSTRRVFGYVPQGNPMFAMSIEDNLRIGNDSLSIQEIEDALKIACAYDFVMAFEDGLKHQIGGREKLLSEGQIQRLAVARALLRKAPVLLLDEATSALDEETERNMIENIRNCESVRTCVIVTHRSYSKSICDGVVVLQDGKCKCE